MSITATKTKKNNGSLVYQFSDGAVLTISPDECQESPREWDTLGTMVCFHQKYRLGDQHDYKVGDFNSWEELAEMIQKDHDVVTIMPIRMYDHSGIALAVPVESWKYPFTCPWDSGQVGFIFATRESVNASFGKLKDEDEVLRKVVKNLTGEIEVYNQYLSGDVWYMGIEVPVNHCEHCERFDLDLEVSVGGFYGRDPAENSMMDCIPVKYHEAIKTA